MKSIKIKKAVTGLLVAMSLVAVAPVAAHAAWRSDSTGWWYQSGNSYYSSGWYQISGTWYKDNLNKNGNQ